MKSEQRLNRMKGRSVAQPPRLWAPQPHAAFTLVEMLVTISVIAVLMGVMMAVLARVRGMSRRVACCSNLKQIGEGIDLFLLDHRGRYPRLDDPGAGDAWYEAVHKQLTGKKTAAAELGETGVRGLFHCPSDMLPDTVHRFTDDGVSYGLNYDVRRHPNSTAWKGGVRLDIYSADDADTYGGAHPLTAADKQADVYNASEIGLRSEFILVADSAGDRTAATPANRYGIVSQVIHPTDTKQQVAGRHNGKGNVLFADNHVELMPAEDGAALDISGTDSAVLHYWTLPADE